MCGGHSGNVFLCPFNQKSLVFVCLSLSLSLSYSALVPAFVRFSPAQTCFVRVVRFRDNRRYHRRGPEGASHGVQNSLGCSKKRSSRPSPASKPTSTSPSWRQTTVDDGSPSPRICLCRFCSRRVWPRSQHHRSQDPEKTDATAISAPEAKVRVASDRIRRRSTR